MIALSRIELAQKKAFISTLNTQQAEHYRKEAESSKGEASFMITMSSGEVCDTRPQDTIAEQYSLMFQPVPSRRN